MATRKAIDMARDRDLDLVEVSPNANPPVCKILDYGKYAYELQKKMRESRKRSQRATIKEVQFRPKIGKHDYDFKMRNAVRFLKAGDRVRIVVRFRGRENAHPEVGEALLMKAAGDLKGLGIIDLRPKREGRVMVMIIAPDPNAQKILKEEKNADPKKDAAPKKDATPKPDADPKKDADPKPDADKGEETEGEDVKKKVIES